jgi:hypothetical protein
MRGIKWSEDSRIQAHNEGYFGVFEKLQTKKPNGRAGKNGGLNKYHGLGHYKLAPPLQQVKKMLPCSETLIIELVSILLFFKKVFLAGQKAGILHFFRRPMWYLLLKIKFFWSRFIYAEISTLRTFPLAAVE